MQKNPLVVATRPGGAELVLLNPETGEFCSFNPTGAWTWEQLESFKTPAELASAFASHFKVSADIAARDVDAYLGQLRKRGLLREA